MKRRVDDLAIFGGRRAFETTLHVGKPNVGDRARLLERINDVLDRRWFTNNGRYVQEFESKICEMLDVRHCIATCNATLALQLAIQALGLTGEVIVPSFTFIATAHALQWQGITPKFCDIDPDTYNLDPREVERHVTPRTSGIIGVHLWGRPCDVSALGEIAARHDLKLLFDAAQAFGSSYKHRMIGDNGDAEVFSFHATKWFNSFEGGAVVTNNLELAEKIRRMSNFGFTGLDEVSCLGTNAKMTEVCAAMGLTSLESASDVVDVNRNNYKEYQRLLADVPGVRVVPYDETEVCTYHYVTLELDEKVAGLSRDVLAAILVSDNISARRYFYPGCHRMEPYRSLFPDAGLLLPNTEKMAARVISLPNGQSIGAADVGEICHIIRFALEHAADISRRLPATILAPEPDLEATAERTDESVLLNAQRPGEAVASPTIRPTQNL